MDLNNRKMTNYPPFPDGKNKCGYERKSPDGLSQPRQNTIMNIICKYYERYGKSSIKFN